MKLSLLPESTRASKSSSLMKMLTHALLKDLDAIVSVVASV